MVETIYTSPNPNYLMHHGVKGQKWGVRKNVQGSMQARGYRAASKYVQRRDIRKLKAQKRSGQISREQYKEQKKAVNNAAMVDRGKALVENNQTIMRTTVKGLGHNAATTAGAFIVAAMSAGAGVPAVGLMAFAGGTAANTANTISTMNQVNEIGAYERSKHK